MKPLLSVADIGKTAVLSNKLFFESRSSLFLILFSHLLNSTGSSLQDEISKSRDSGKKSKAIMLLGSVWKIISLLIIAKRPIQINHLSEY